MALKSSHCLPRTLLSLVLTLCSTGTIHAKSDNWYQVEVLLFAQQAESELSSEQWHDRFKPNYPTTLIRLDNTILLPEEPDLLHEAQPPSTVDAVSDAPLNTLVETADTPSLSTEIIVQDSLLSIEQIAQAALLKKENINKKINEKINNSPFVLLPDSERTLLSQAQRISETSGLRLLDHLAWRQPVLNRDIAEPILIQSGAQFNAEFELEGTLTISLGRYLHARTDLYFSEFAQMQSRQELDWKIFAEDKLDFGQSEWSTGFSNHSATQFVRATTANLKQSRRMRSDELHYIDHPLLGILIKISPYKRPDLALQLEEIARQTLPSKRPLPDSAISPNL
jgi:hypothetical protein